MLGIEPYPGVMRSHRQDLLQIVSIRVPSRRSKVNLLLKFLPLNYTPHDKQQRRAVEYIPVRGERRGGVGGGGERATHEPWRAEQACLLSRTPASLKPHPSRHSHVGL